MTAHRALIERLAAAAEGSRADSTKVMEALGWERERLPGTKRLSNWWIPPNGNGNPRRQHELPDPTMVLDDALALLPDGMPWASTWTGQFGRFDTHTGIHTEAATVPLAASIALLRIHEAQS